MNFDNFSFMIFLAQNVLMPPNPKIFQEIKRANTRKLYTTDITAMKSTAYKEKFVHLQIGLCKCEYLEALGPVRLWSFSMVTSWLSYIPFFEYMKSIFGSNLI